MQSLMKQYGRTILCCIAAAAVIGLVFGLPLGEGRGLIRFVYKQALEDTASSDAFPFGDAGAGNEVWARRKPKIVYRHRKTVFKQAVNVREMFAAEDMEGNILPVEVTDILDGFGASLLYPTEESRQKNEPCGDPAGFLFPAPGVYTVYVKAADRENMTSYKQYKIPVSGS